MRCAVDDVTALEQLLKLFFGFARPEVAQFRKAVEQFKTDLPAVLAALRDMIERAHDTNAERASDGRTAGRTISVIIGNPPYNANQLNESENNKNREYREIGQRIKATYIDASTAQKTKLYDLYARFFRWVSDRLAANGVLAFITNRSFIDSRTFDGFRRVVMEEFAAIRIVDLGGDIRANPKLSGTKHNVFGIQTVVAISFLVKRAKRQGCRILYTRRPELETGEEKLAFLGRRLFSLGVVTTRPDAARKIARSRKRPSSTTSTACCTTRSTARNTPRT